MKRIAAAFLALCLILSLAACAVAPAQPATTTQSTTAAPGGTTIPRTDYPITVTDHAGREVTIERRPEKLVSGYYISSSALIALGLADKMVGIEAKADKRPIYALSAPQLIQLPNVGTAKLFDTEGCLALQPDLVILPLKLKSAAADLEKLGISVLLVNPESQDLVKEMISMIALATDTQPRGTALLERMENLENTLNSLSAKDAPKVYMAGNSSLLSTAGGKMYQSYMIALAGGANVAAEITDSNWADISYEQLLSWNPDYIVLASDSAVTVEEVLADPNLAEVNAVKNGKVLHIPGDAEAWDSPVPGGILGSLWLAAQLHGDVISVDAAAQAAADFYADFYGFEYNKK